MMEWLVGLFPQQYAHEFYVVKGLLALAATIGIIAHMSRTWSNVETWGRRLRYFALLYFSALITYASVEQITLDALVAPRNIGAMIGVFLVIAAVWVSLLEDRTPRP